jgi:hypothetical protein
MSKIIHQLKLQSTFASQPTSPRPSWLPSTFRLSTFGLLLIIHFSPLTFQSCGLDIEDPTPPSPPVWVQKSLPEEWPERGVDAHESGGIYLEWEPNPETNIMAYLIYRAQYFDQNDSLGEYERIFKLETISNTALEFVDTDIEIRTKYFYKLEAENGAQNLSDFSDSLYYTILPPLDIKYMAPNGVTDALNPSRELSWRYDSHLEMEDYCLTILTRESELFLRKVIVPGNYLGVGETFEVSDSLNLELDQVYKWRIDIGAQYVDGFETSASESAWATFLYSGDSVRREICLVGVRTCSEEGNEFF